MTDKSIYVIPPGQTNELKMSLKWNRPPTQLTNLWDALSVVVTCVFAICVKNIDPGPDMDFFRDRWVDIISLYSGCSFATAIAWHKFYHRKDGWTICWRLSVMERKPVFCIGRLHVRMLEGRFAIICLIKDRFITYCKSKKCSGHLFWDPHLYYNLIFWTLITSHVFSRQWHHHNLRLNIKFSRTVKRPNTDSSTPRNAYWIFQCDFIKDAGFILGYTHDTRHFSTLVNSIKP